MNYPPKISEPEHTALYSPLLPLAAFGNFTLLSALQKPLSAGLFLLIALFLSVGCATVDDLKKAVNDPGVTSTFDADYDTTYETALKVLSFQGADILEADKAKSRIFAKQGMSHVGAGTFSYGELLGLYFVKVTESETQIKFVQKRRSKMTIPTQEWNIDFFVALRNQLHYQKKQAA